MHARELSGLHAKPQAGCVALHAHDAQMLVAVSVTVLTVCCTAVGLLASCLAPTAVGPGRHKWPDMLRQLCVSSLRTMQMETHLSWFQEQLVAFQLLVTASILGGEGHGTGASPASLQESCLSHKTACLWQVREAEEGASRARAARREDAKRAAKERSQMAERLKVGAGCLPDSV